MLEAYGNSIICGFTEAKLALSKEAFRVFTNKNFHLFNQELRNWVHLWEDFESRSVIKNEEMRKSMRRSYYFGWFHRKYYNRKGGKN